MFWGCHHQPTSLHAGNRALTAIIELQLQLPYAWPMTCRIVPLEALFDLRAAGCEVPDHNVNAEQLHSSGTLADVCCGALVAWHN